MRPRPASRDVVVSTSRVVRRALPLLFAIKTPAVRPSGGYCAICNVTLHSIAGSNRCRRLARSRAVNLQIKRRRLSSSSSVVVVAPSPPPPPPAAAAAAVYITAVAFFIADQRPIVVNNSPAAAFRAKNPGCASAPLQ